LNQFP